MLDARGPAGAKSQLNLISTEGALFPQLDLAKVLQPAFAGEGEVAKEAGKQRK